MEMWYWHLLAGSGHGSNSCTICSPHKNPPMPICLLQFKKLRLVKVNKLCELSKIISRDVCMEIQSYEDEVYCKGSWLFYRIFNVYGYWGSWKIIVVSCLGQCFKISCCCTYQQYPKCFRRTVLLNSLIIGKFIF